MYDQISGPAGVSMLAGTIEQELGRRFSKTARTPKGAARIRSAANAAAASAMSRNQTMLDSTLSTTQRFLMSKLNDLADDTKQSIRDGSIQMQDSVLFTHRGFTGGTSGGSLLDVWNSTNELIDGYSNISKNYLPKNANLVLAGIRIAYGIAPITGGPSAFQNYNLGVATYINTNVYNTATNVSYIPPQILNGELEVSLNGDVIVNLPLSKFFINSPAANLTSTPGYVDLAKLESFKLIKEGQNFLVRIKLPLNSQLPAAPVDSVHAFKFEFHGQMTLPGRRSR